MERIRERGLHLPDPRNRIFHTVPPASVLDSVSGTSKETLHCCRIESAFRYSNNAAVVTPHGKICQCNRQTARSNEKLQKRLYTAQVSLLLCYGNFIPLTPIQCKPTSLSGRHLRRKHGAPGRWWRGGELQRVLILDLSID